METLVLFVAFVAFVALVLEGELVLEVFVVFVALIGFEIVFVSLEVFEETLETSSLLWVLQ